MTSLAECVQIAKQVGDASDSPLLQAIDIGRRVRVRARGIPDQPAPMLPDEGFGHWVEVLIIRAQRHYDAVVLVTGVVGSGKSTLAMRMAYAADPTFTIQGRLCYTAESLLKIYETILPGQAVLFDEGVRGLLAGDQASMEQKALIQALALVREKGALLFICAPSIWNIAKQVRQNRATLWVHVLGRGLALVHERVERLRYVPDATLGLMRSEECPYLKWKAYPKNSRVWREYSTEKKLRLDEYLVETREMLHKKRGAGPERGRPLTPAEKQRRYRERKEAKEAPDEPDEPEN